MDPRELHKNTVHLINVMHLIKDCNMGLSIKRAEIKKLKKQILTTWLKNKDMIPINSIPSKNIVMTIGQGYDQKYGTSFINNIFNDLSVSDYSCSDGSDIDRFSDWFPETRSEITI